MSVPLLHPVGLNDPSVRLCLLQASRPPLHPQSTFIDRNPTYESLRIAARLSRKVVFSSVILK
jgi:hypothetical protein